MARTRTWRAVVWVLAVVATVLNGVVVGHGAVALQFFGESADAEDYAVSAGGYAAAALVLVLAVPALVARGGPRWLVWAAGGSAAVLGSLAVGSAQASARAEQSGPGINSAWDGVGGVLWAPWTWVLVACGLHGLSRLVARARPRHPDG